VTSPTAQTGLTVRTFVLGSGSEDDTTKIRQLLSEHDVVSKPGEFLFVPPGVPHEAINLSATEPARAVVARNDPDEQDKVQPYLTAGQS